MTNSETHLLETRFASTRPDRSAPYSPLRAIANAPLCKAVLRFGAVFGMVWLADNSLIQAAPAEENWPAWRGPLGTGIAPANASPPLSWSETEHVRWKVKIPGRGSATPIVWDNRIFVQTAIPTGKMAEPTASQGAAPGSGPADRPGGDEDAPGGRRRGGRGGPGFGGAKPVEYYQFAILCLDRPTGRVLWQRVAREEVPHEAHHRTEGTFASSSPVTDGQHVFAYFGSRGLHCYDLNGQLEWSQDFGDMRIAMGFGEGSSPALHGNTLVVNWDHEGDSFIIALDKRTGRTLWRQPRTERTTWATPLILEYEGTPQAIVPASGKIRSYDLTSGDVLWECGGLTRNVIPSPVAGPGMVYCASGYGGSALLAIRLGGKGDLSGSQAIAWKYNRSTPYVPSPLLYQDKLYFFASNNGVLSCFDAKTGRPLIETERVEALAGVYASPIAAGGKVYLVGRNGATVVLEPADTLQVLATNRLDEKIDASPVAVGRELFLRGQQFLYCLAEE